MRKSLIKYSQYAILIAVIIITLIPAVQAAGFSKAQPTEKLGVYKAYNADEKIVAISNILNDPVINLQLINNECHFNGLNTDADCIARIKVNPNFDIMTDEVNYGVDFSNLFGLGLRDWDWQWYQQDIVETNFSYDCVISIINSTIYSEENKSWSYPKTYIQGTCGRIVNEVQKTDISIGDILSKGKEYIIEITGKVAPGSKVEWIPTFYGVSIPEWAIWLAENMTTWRNVSVQQTTTSSINKILVPINGTSGLSDGVNMEYAYCLLPNLPSRTVNTSIILYQAASNNFSNFRCVNASDNQELKIAGWGNNSVYSTAKKQGAFQSANVIWAWSFNDTASSNDETGLVGEAEIYNWSFYPQGLIGTALNMTGTNSKWEIAADPDGISENDPHSIEFWVLKMPNVAPGSSCSIFTQWGGGGSKNIIIFLNSTGLNELRYTIGGLSFNSIFGNASASLTGWNHIVVTVAGDGTDHNSANVPMKAYLNGKMVAEALMANFDINTDGSGMGRAIDDTSCSIVVDEFRYYNVTLTPDEVKARYDMLDPSRNLTQAGAEENVTQATPPNFNITECREIDTQGNYMFLNDITGAYDINATDKGCIHISVPNVSIDCNGFLITNDTDYLNYMFAFSNVNNITIKNCNIPTSSPTYFGGLWMSTSRDVYIENVSVINDGGAYGFVILNSNFTTINNSLTMNGYSDGIHINDSKYITVTNSYFSNIGDTAVKLISSYDCNVTNNNFNVAVVGAAFALHHSSRNLFYNNTCTDFASCIYMGSFGGAPISENNTIYNNFFNSSINNIWYDGDVLPFGVINFFNITPYAGINIIGGPTIGGNFYNDYTGYDTDNDGIGNIPYYIYDYTSEFEDADYAPLTGNNVTHESVYVSNVSITPGVIYKADTMTCYANFNTDLPAVYGNVTLYWKNGTTLYSTASYFVPNGDLVSLALPPSIQHKGETWNCEANVTDGYIANATLVVVSKTIQNTAPTLTTVTYTPSSNIYKTTIGLNCTLSEYGDVDNDTLTLSYLHYKNNVSTGVTTQNITNSSYSKGDVLICQGEIYDGEAQSNKLNSSASDAVLNSAPISGTPTLTPAPIAYTSQDLQCTIPYIADPDSDKANVTSRWYKNNVLMVTQIETGSYSVGSNIKFNLTSGNLTAGDTWLCEGYVTDSSGEISSKYNSSSTTIYYTSSIAAQNLYPLNGTISENQEVIFQCNGSSVNPLTSVEFIIKPKEAENQTVQRTAPDEYSRNGGVSISNEAYAYDDDNNLITYAQLGISGEGTITSYWYYNYTTKGSNATLDIAGMLGYGGEGDDIIFNIALWNYTTSAWGNIFTHTSTWPTPQNIKDNYILPEDSLSGGKLRVRLELTQKNVGVGSKINGTRVTWNMKNSSVKTITGSPTYSQDNFTNFFYYNGEYNWYCIYNDTLSTANDSAMFTFERQILTVSSTYPLNITYATASVPVDILASYEVTSCYFSLNSGINISMTSINSTYYNATVTATEGSNYIITGCFDNTTYWNSTGRRYFAVDTTPPNVTITSPIDYMNYSSDYVPFNYTVTGATSCWMNLNNGPNMTINETTENYALTLFDTGNMTLNMFCKDTSNNYMSPVTVNFFAKPKVQICSNDKWIFIANLNSGGSTSLATLTLPKECIGDTIVFKNDLSASSAANQFYESKILYGILEQEGENATSTDGTSCGSGVCANAWDDNWNTYANIGGVGASNPAYIVQNYSNPSHWPTAKIYFKYASGGASPSMNFWCYNNQRLPVLNYEIRDESINTSITAALSSSTVTSWKDSYAIYNTSYSFINSTGNSQYSWCAWPSDEDIKLDYAIQFTNTSYGVRTFRPFSPITVNTNTPLNYIAYLLNYANGITAYFKVQDQLGNAISMVLGVMTKIIGGNPVILNSQYTDGTGTTSFFADPDETYTFTFSKDGYNSASTTVKPIPTTYTVVLTRRGAGLYANASFWDGLTWRLNPLDTVIGANTTINITYSMNSSHCDLSGVMLYVRTSNGTIYTNYSNNSCTNYLTLQINTDGNANLFSQQCSQKWYTLNFSLLQGCNIATWTVISGAEPGKFSLFTIIKDIGNFSHLGVNNFTKAIFVFIFLLFLLSQLPNVTMYTNEFLIVIIVLVCALFTLPTSMGGFGLMDIKIFVVILAAGAALFYLSWSSKV